MTSRGGNLIKEEFHLEYLHRMMLFPYQSLLGA